MEGPITVKGQPFIGAMPKNDFLSDEEIAQVLTYIRQSFGNDADAVRKDMVGRVRRSLEREAAGAPDSLGNQGEMVN